jgi:cytochrome P450
MTIGAAGNCRPYLTIPEGMMSYAQSIRIEDLEADPYPIYARLRREQPVAFVPAANVWFATRWRDVETVTKNPDIFSAEAPTSPVEISFGKPTILTSDGPVHKELRSAIEPQYRPRPVMGYIDALVRPIAEQQLAQFESKPKAELMADYFEPISALSLVRSFGLDEVDVPILRRWFHGLSQGAINYERDPARQAISDQTCAEIDAVLLPVLNRLANNPNNSPLSHMLHSGMPEGKTRDPAFVLPSVKVTLLGGMQEPGHGAGSILVGLLQNPDQFAALIANKDEWLPRAVDEGLRWVAPIGTQMRIATQDIEIAGVTVPKDAPIAAVLASANHDEDQFENGGDFDMARTKASSATFGFGGHFCAGKWFAKAQIEIALRVLIDRYPALRIDPEQIPVFRGWEFRAPTSLHVILN